MGFLAPTVSSSIESTITPSSTDLSASGHSVGSGESHAGFLGVRPSPEPDTSPRLVRSKISGRRRRPMRARRSTGWPTGLPTGCPCAVQPRLPIARHESAACVGTRHRAKGPLECGLGTGRIRAESCRPLSKLFASAMEAPGALAPSAPMPGIFSSLSVALRGERAGHTLADPACAENDNLRAKYPSGRFVYQWRRGRGSTIDPAIAAPTPISINCGGLCVAFLLPAPGSGRASDRRHSPR